MFEVLAFSKQAFPLDPEFLDSVSVSYNVGAAVNGAFEGGVGLNIINLITQKIDTIVRPVKKFGNFASVGVIHKYKNSICYTLCDPLDSFTYRYMLVDSQREIISFGEGYFKDLDGKVVIRGQNDVLFLDDNHEMRSDKDFLIVYRQNIQVLKKPITFKYSKGHLSPNGKYMFYDDLKSNYYLIDLETFNKTRIMLPQREIHSVTWSADCQKFAIVQDHESLSNTDKIRLFKIK